MSIRSRLVRVALVGTVVVSVGVTAQAAVRSAGSGPSRNTPYGGTARSLRGIVQAEDFDAGGQGVAYHDTSRGTRGPVYRPGDVDFRPVPKQPQAVAVDVAPGEWLQYT